MKVLVVMGTRPEAIKLAPVLRRLKADGRFSVRLCLTAQHRELLDSNLRAFNLRPDVDLNLMREGQSPRAVLSRVLRGMGPVLARERPDLVLVQGDTTSALGAALAASRRGIPVGHVEAGLRSFDLREPWPEEGNRRRIDAVSELLFAPTPAARKNLLSEGLDPRRIRVTGNTVVDALRWALRRGGASRLRVRGLPRSSRIIVLTLHRRESFGRPLARLLAAIRDAAERLPGWTIIYPVHPNPAVSRAARRLLRHPRVRLVPPLDYVEFVRLMRRAAFVVTDSGGIQEEAPTLGKPVLVVRRKTDRPEALGRGAWLAGTDGPRLSAAIRRWASGRLPAVPAPNPFGDGKAAERIARAIKGWASARGSSTAT